MALFIAVTALIVGVANMGFQQGQANPGKNFFSSDNHIVQDGSSID
ncbi:MULTISPECIES: hypothetical protein [Bradyrhizobium]|nr:hypothetical protein [Bradyrhizobium liaoningense]MBR0988117.1 hypothetical protein [Bradyrhizobium liaoningense]